MTSGASHGNGWRMSSVCRYVCDDWEVRNPLLEHRVWSNTLFARRPAALSVHFVCGKCTRWKVLPRSISQFPILQENISISQEHENGALTFRRNLWNSYHFGACMCFSKLTMAIVWKDRTSHVMSSYGQISGGNGNIIISLPVVMLGYVMPLFTQLTNVWFVLYSSELKAKTNTRVPLWESQRQSGARSYHGGKEGLDSIQGRILKYYCKCIILQMHFSPYIYVETRHFKQSLTKISCKNRPWR